MFIENMKKCPMLWNLITESIFEYETSKVVQIRSWKIGFVYRLIQVAIILYVSLWVMYIEKGYQIFDYPVSGVTAKLKGIAFANLTDIPSIGMRVWDTADFVIPPQQNSAFFVATNMVITPNQSLGFCDESTDTYGVKCNSDNDCKKGKPIHIGSGVGTGKCVESTKIRGLKVCQIYGWCPTEHDVMPIKNGSLLNSAPNFTVLLKNSIEFTTFKIKRRNILKWMTKQFLYSCRYDPHHWQLKFCPIFRLYDIVKYSDAANQNIWIYGGLMSIHIEWNCDLDFNVEHCVPEYTFRRLDDFNEEVGKGWNFRYSYHYVENGTEKRTLIKVYGIQFFITVSGRGGQFNPFKFSMNLGSGLALLGIASVFCDLLILNIVRKRELYKKARVDSLQSVLNNREFDDRSEKNNSKTDDGNTNTSTTSNNNTNNNSINNNNISNNNNSCSNTCNNIIKLKRDNLISDYHFEKGNAVKFRNTKVKYTRYFTEESFHSRPLIKDNIQIPKRINLVNFSQRYSIKSFHHSHSSDCLSRKDRAKYEPPTMDNEFTKLSKSTETAWIDDCVV